MAAAGKNVIAFASGLVLASLLVPVKKRITDVLERIQYHDTYRARRALLDIARDFAHCRGPARRSFSAIIQRVEEALRVVPCSLFLFEGPGRDPDAAALADALSGEDRLRLAAASEPRSEQSPPAALLRLHALGYRAFFAMRCGGELVGALGVGLQGRPHPALLRGRGPPDGRARAGEPGLRKRAPVRRARRAARGDPDAPGVPGERHPVLLLGHRRARSRRADPHGEPGVRAADRPDARTSCAGCLSPTCCTASRSARAPEDGDEWRFETRLATPDGDERDLQLSVSAFRGSPDRRVLVVEDMTDRIRAERALAERERLASLGVLAAGVAHEVNTPIAGLSSYAQMLLSETSPGDPALHDPQEDGAADLPRRPPRQQPAGIRAPASRARR